MMLLAEQIQAILYHLIMGWCYGLLFSVLCAMLSWIRFAWIKAGIEIIFHLGMTVLVFYGLYTINGGVTNVYLILLFCLGVCLYYRFYFYRIYWILMASKTLMKPWVVSVKKKKKCYQEKQKQKKQKRREKRKRKLEKRRKKKLERKKEKKKADKKQLY